jgi:hypothetical protein
MVVTPLLIVIITLAILAGIIVLTYFTVGVWTNSGSSQNSPTPDPPTPDPPTPDPPTPDPKGSLEFITNFDDVPASSGYLSTPGAPQYNLGTNNFTIEWFQNMPSGSRDQIFPRIFAIGSFDITNLILQVSIESGTLYFWSENSIVFAEDLTTITIPHTVFDRWSHIAITRESNTAYLYVNGNQISSASFTSDIQNPENLDLVIGNESPPSEAGPYTGFLSNFRITNGTALYTGSTYTVPTAPLESGPETALLLKASTEATAYIDSSSYNAILTPNNGSDYGVYWNDTQNPFN